MNDIRVHPVRLLILFRLILKRVHKGNKIAHLALHNSKMGVMVGLIPDVLVRSDEGLGLFQVKEDTEDVVLGIVDVVARGHCRARIDLPWMYVWSMSFLCYIVSASVYDSTMLSYRL